MADTKMTPGQRWEAAFRAMEACDHDNDRGTGDEFLALLSEGLCPNCRERLTRHGDHGDCPCCKAGLALRHGDEFVVVIHYGEEAQNA